MAKVSRQDVYNKYGQRCAYCGLPIEFTKMQVDHCWPKFLKNDQNDNNDRIENLMPSCQKCNSHKGGMKLEDWRRELSRQVSMLLKNAQFNRAIRFGQIRITPTPIIFWFERTFNNG